MNDLENPLDQLEPAGIQQDDLPQKALPDGLAPVDHVKLVADTNGSDGSANYLGLPPEGEEDLVSGPEEDGTVGKPPRTQEEQVLEVANNPGPTQIQPSFLLGETASQLEVTYASPSDMAVTRLEQEKAPAITTEPGNDAWFMGLRDSNRYRPGSESFAEVETQSSRPYDESRMKRPRFSGRTVNPFARRMRKVRLKRSSAVFRDWCRRCGAAFEGSRCHACGTEFCPACGDALENGECKNESCCSRPKQACGNSGEDESGCGT